MGKHNSSSVGRLIVFIVLGLVLGGIFGEALGLVLGQIGEMINAGADNPVRNFFVSSFVLDLGLKDGVLIDLYLLKFRLGFGLNLNIASVIGMMVSLYIMKWSGDY